MSPDKERQLFEKYPNLYSGAKKPIMQNLMSFGFECGDGWYDIIDELSAVLEPKGVVALQVKEKFGTLRYYTEGHDDEADEAISNAEMRSEVTCESCGHPGKLRTEGWMVTNCDWCWAHRRREKPKTSGEHQEVS